MPRSITGNYTLPLPPVVPNTVISSAWANTTMDDVAQAITNSLDRYGSGGMVAPFRLADGTEALPAFAFSAETGSGLWREGTGVVSMSILGTTVQSWTANGINVVGSIVVGPNGIDVTGDSGFSGSLGVTGDVVVGGALVVAGVPIVPVAGGWVAKTGDTMTGQLTAPSLRVNNDVVADTYLTLRQQGVRQWLVGMTAGVGSFLVHDLDGAVTRLTLGTNGAINLNGAVGIGVGANGNYGYLFVNSAPAAVPAGDSNIPAGKAYATIGDTGQSVPEWLLLRGTYANAAHKAGILLQDEFLNNGQYGGMYIQTTNHQLTFGRFLNGTAGVSNGTLNPFMRVDQSGEVIIGPGATPYGGILTICPTVNPTADLFVTANQLCVGESSNNPQYRMQVGFLTVGGVWSGSLQAIQAGVAAPLYLNGAGGPVYYDDTEIGYRDVPLYGTLGGGANIPDAARGQLIKMSGSLVVQNGFVGPGGVITLLNVSGAPQTIAPGGGALLLWAGGAAASGVRTLASGGIATIWWETTAAAWISGSGLS